MENAPRVEAAVAFASMLADAARAMAQARFTVSGAPDELRSPEDRTIFVGPFVVQAPPSGWVLDGKSLARFMVGHAQNIDGRSASHVRSTDAYLAHLAPFLDAALVEDDGGHRTLLETTRDFIAVNELIVAKEGSVSLHATPLPSKPLLPRSCRRTEAAAIRGLKPSRSSCSVRFRTGPQRPCMQVQARLTELDVCATSSQPAHGSCFRPFPTPASRDRRIAPTHVSARRAQRTNGAGSCNGPTSGSRSCGAI